MRSFFVIGAGVILLVLPTSLISDYSDFSRFLGGGLILGSLASIFFFRHMSKIFISEEEIAKIEAPNRTRPAKKSFPKITASLILLIIIIGGFLFNQFLTWKLNSSSQNKQFTINISISKKNAK